jgi:hypothetical protein
MPLFDISFARSTALALVLAALPLRAAAHQNAERLRYGTGTDSGITPDPSRQHIYTQSAFDISFNVNGLLVDSDIGIGIDFGDTQQPSGRSAPPLALSNARLFHPPWRPCTQWLLLDGSSLATMYPAVVIT